MLPSRHGIERRTVRSAIVRALARLAAAELFAPRELQRP